MKIDIGIDEAGRGPWAGPVVACACGLSPKLDANIRKQFWDSKKIPESQRNTLYKQLIDLSILKKPHVFFWVWVVDNWIIDEVNIRQANREAMRRAIVEILRKIPHKRIWNVMIDGRDNYVFEELSTPPTYIVWGDGKVAEIGAASIIAKVFRDKIMAQYATLYPHFGFETHKWYGTKRHKESLKKSSDVTGIHRMSYKPIKEIL